MHLYYFYEVGFNYFVINILWHFCVILSLRGRCLIKQRLVRRLKLVSTQIGQILKATRQRRRHNAPKVSQVLRS